MREQKTSIREWLSRKFKTATNFRIPINGNLNVNRKLLHRQFTHWRQRRKLTINFQNQLILGR